MATQTTPTTYPDMVSNNVREIITVNSAAVLRTLAVSEVYSLVHSRSVELDYDLDLSYADFNKMKQESVNKILAAIYA